MVFCYFEPGEFAQSQFTQIMHGGERLLLHRQEPLHTNFGYRVTIRPGEDPGQKDPGQKNPGQKNPGRIWPTAQLVVEAPDPITVALADLHPDIREHLADFIPADLLDLPKTDRVRLDDTHARNEYNDTPTRGQARSTPTRGQATGIPTRGLVRGIPTRGLVRGIPTRGLVRGILTRGQNRGTPPSGQNRGTPPSGSR